MQSEQKNFAERNNGIEILSKSYQLYVPPQAEKVELDLGCGSGYFAVELAKRFPERHILAADVMLGRLRKTVTRKNHAKITNVTPLRVEARMLVGRMLPDNSIDRLHLLCPDPWPKGKHRSHRLLTSDFTARIHRVLKEDGIFHFSSDDINYVQAVTAVVAASGLFTPADAAECAADLTGLTTSFERRWLAQGKPVHHFYWRRLPLPPHSIGH